MMMRPALPQAGMLGLLTSVHLLLLHSSCQFTLCHDMPVVSPPKRWVDSMAAMVLPKQAKLNTLMISLRLFPITA